MTDREKIIEIIKRNGTYNGRSLSFDYYVIQPDDLADALIAAGLKFDTVVSHTATFDLAQQEQINRLERDNAALRERLNKAVELPFVIFDKTTGKEADEYEIALHEDWAKHLMYCDMDGFAIQQDGTLLLVDECSNIAYCPSDRFVICNEARLKELQGGEG